MIQAVFLDMLSVGRIPSSLNDLPVVQNDRQ